MTTIDWAKRPLQRYSEFSGRAPRAEFWWFVLAYLILTIVVMIVENLLGIDKMVGGVYGPLTLLIGLALFVPSLAVSVRRLHDTNRSAWWLLLCLPYLVAVGFIVQGMMAGDASALASGGLLSLVGFVCVLVLIVFYALAGTPGPNRFGPDPYGREDTATA